MLRDSVDGESPKRIEVSSGSIGKIIKHVKEPESSYHVQITQGKAGGRVVNVPSKLLALTHDKPESSIAMLFTHWILIQNSQNKLQQFERN